MTTNMDIAAIAEKLRQANKRLREQEKAAVEEKLSKSNGKPHPTVTQTKRRIVRTSPPEKNKEVSGEIVESKKETEKRKTKAVFALPENTPARIGGFSRIQLAIVAYCYLFGKERGVSVRELVGKLLSPEEIKHHNSRSLSDGAQRVIRNALRAPVKRGFVVRPARGHYVFKKPVGKDGQMRAKDAKVGAYLVELRRQQLRDS